VRVSRSNLRKVIASNLGLSINERKSRAGADVERTAAADAGSVKKIEYNESTLKAIHQDRVKVDQTYDDPSNGENNFDPDLFGLSEEDKLHDLVEELSSNDVIGNGGSINFTPWQPWSQAASGERENTIAWTLVNNVSGHDGVPDSRAFILTPTTIGLKTKAEVDAAAARAAEEFSDLLSDFESGLDTAHSAGNRKGTDEPKFDRGLKKACGAWLEAPHKGADGLGDRADPYILAKGEWDDVDDMITGEFSGGDETDRLAAWADCSGIYAESVELTPAEVWLWEAASRDSLLLEQNEETRAEFDPANLSSPGTELFIERVEDILSGYPNIGWGHRDEVDLPEIGGSRISGITYFFSKTAADEASSLRAAGLEALKKISQATERNSPADRDALRRIEADSLRTRGIATAEAPAGEDGEEEETVSESIIRSIIRNQLTVERRERSTVTATSEEGGSEEEAPSDDEIDSGGGTAGGNIDLIKNEMTSQGITDKRLRLAVLGVIGKESGFMPQSEKGYGNTSNSRIVQIFGDRVSSENLPDGKSLDQLKADDEAFFNHVYGGRYGNDDPGDGYKYRGRGFNQITFKGTYEKYGLGGDPDSLNDPAVAARVAVEFLAKRLDKIKGRDHEYGVGGLPDAIKDAAQANAGLGKKGSALARAIQSTTDAISDNFGEEPEASEIS